MKAPELKREPVALEAAALSPEHCELVLAVWG